VHLRSLVLSVREQTVTEQQLRLDERPKERAGRHPMRLQTRAQVHGDANGRGRKAVVDQALHLQRGGCNTSTRRARARETSRFWYLRPQMLGMCNFLQRHTHTHGTRTTRSELMLW
jgi:hypothetical protein